MLHASVARAARALLVDVVEHGTARRAQGAMLGPDGSPILLGGETGTGDHRHRSFAADGRELGERPLSRSAAFAFLIGDRHYGVVTAHVAGPDGARHRFTSSLAVQLFRELAPSIRQVAIPDPA